jgi:hypothetical protein
MGVQARPGNVSSVIDDQDWRLEGQEQSLRQMLQRAELRWTVWFSHDGRDHDHCEFCWARIWDRPRSDSEYGRGYVTRDHNHWICEPCFADFRDRFALATLGSAA